MTLTPEGQQAPFSAWHGLLVVGVFCLTPLAAWLGTRAFAPMLALGGLLALPGIQPTRPGRSVLLILGVLLAWADISAIWSPFSPRSLAVSTPVKLALEAVSYWSFVCAATTARADVRRLAGRILAFGAAALGALMVFEAMTGGGLYIGLRTLVHEPMRPDLAVRNVARAIYPLVLLTPAAALAALRERHGLRLILPMLLGVAAASIVFDYDAPLLALGAGGAAGLSVYRFPRSGPTILAAIGVLFLIGAPAVVWGTRTLGWYDPLQHLAPLSWAQRMGYWRAASDLIGALPLRGWGLDASRMFDPRIKLHPHDSALQIWLELGAIGAALVAALWVTVLLRLRRDTSDPAAALAAATAVIYLTLGAVSFGVWQEWWLALAALASAACLIVRDPNPDPVQRPSSS